MHVGSFYWGVFFVVGKVMFAKNACKIIDNDIQ
jgi:hypothetical protein